ncbi:unnamed protein product [Rotaria socialis]|uniref:Uncharacterized protein n=2 Tax=Rotaria socialis TaxID=392032 RepID=A0A821QSL1_9BILA|nr:unnamed protein product [Rotaria socialis]CAF4582719.1 unnamed protein product [Rotaria socialis]CAF4830121.1 unnamed protein product [Rotaria socialis]CAF4853507.1 unnamed protein product [Rotaria socialis]
MNKNEDLRTKYPPFESSSHFNIIHLHYKSTIDTLNQLISKAYKTKRYVVDTESQKGETERHGALIQIQFLHSSGQSTIILIEINYLPDKQSNLYKKIIELCEIIFNNGNEVLAWGPLANEFTNFHHLDLIHIGKNIIPINLQSLFSSGKNIQITHPEMERRDEITADTSYYPYDTPGDNDDMDDEQQINDILFGSHRQTHVNSNDIWSLQKAIETTFGKFLDKFETVNYWKCGLDLQLNTWEQKLFSKHHYDKTTEQQRRLSMIQYVAHDCLAVADLYFHKYPEKINDHHIPEQTTTSTNIIKNLKDDLSEVSDDEIIQILKPRFDQPQPTPQAQHDEMPILMIEVTPEEMETFDLPDVQIKQQQQQQQQPQITTTLTKAERQRKKSIKLKWKQKRHPNFQNKIKRPIYYRYDYQKIRSQLKDDNIHTSHQITINKNKGEDDHSDEDNCPLCSMIKTPNSLLCRSDEIWCLPMTNATDKIDPTGVCIPHEQNAQYHGEILLDNSTLSNRESLCLIIMAKEKHKIKITINQNNFLNQRPDLEFLIYDGQQSQPYNILANITWLTSLGPYNQMLCSNHYEIKCYSIQQLQRLQHLQHLQHLHLNHKHHK